MHRLGHRATAVVVVAHDHHGVRVRQQALLPEPRPASRRSRARRPRRPRCRSVGDACAALGTPRQRAGAASPVQLCPPRLRPMKLVRRSPSGCVVRVFVGRGGRSRSRRDGCAVSVVGAWRRAYRRHPARPSDHERVDAVQRADRGYAEGMNASTTWTITASSMKPAHFTPPSILAKNEIDEEQRSRAAGSPSSRDAVQCVPDVAVVVLVDAPGPVVDVLDHCETRPSAIARGLDHDPDGDQISRARGRSVSCPLP